MGFIATIGIPTFAGTAIVVLLCAVLALEVTVKVAVEVAMKTAKEVLALGQKTWCWGRVRPRYIKGFVVTISPSPVLLFIEIVPIIKKVSLTYMVYKQSFGYRLTSALQNE